MESIAIIGVIILSYGFLLNRISQLKKTIETKDEAYEVLKKAFNQGYKKLI